MPGSHRFFRYLAPFYPHTFEGFDLRGYDTIVSSTTSWAKGVIVPPGAVHVCYVNTVARFAFDFDRYVGNLAFGSLAKPLIDRLIAWDKRAALRPTRLVANSANVAARIERYYGRSADVLHCPVDIDRFSIGPGDGDYFLVASRLLPYKRVDLAIDAAQQAGVRLVIAGTGPAQRDLRERARGTGATLLGYVGDAELNGLIGAARAVILPGEEDFGLVPLEAAAAGRPTIAYRAGGALETVIEGQTGAFFDRPTPDSLADVLRGFDSSQFDARRLRAHAEGFAPAQFVRRLKEIVAATTA